MDKSRRKQDHGFVLLPLHRQGAMLRIVHPDGVVVLDDDTDLDVTVFGESPASAVVSLLTPAQCLQLLSDLARTPS